MFDTSPSHTASATLMSNMPQIFLCIGFALILYALVVRPQAKRERERQTLLSLLAKGDIIYTSGGVIGRIVRLYDKFVCIEIGKGIQIYLQKDAIVDTVPKGSLKGIIDFA